MAQGTYESILNSFKALEGLLDELKDIQHQVQELRAGMTGRKRRPSQVVKKDKEVDPLIAAAEASLKEAYDREAGKGEIELPGPTMGWW